MWSTIFFILASLPLCLAAPSPITATSLQFATNKILQNLQRSTLTVSDRQVGLNFFPCLSDDDCVGPRSCVASLEVVPPVPCDSTSDQCACLPDDLSSVPCNDDSDCQEGEVCFLFPNLPQTVCTSETVAGADRNTNKAASGLTLDPCEKNGDCHGNRSCYDFGTLGICKGGDCRCIGQNPCSSDSACEEGEGCFGLGDIGDAPSWMGLLLKGNFCASRAAVADAVCIGTHSLTHISKDQLVFETNAVAHVLCDMSNSCATPGHIVRYKGKGMMMKSYCELNGCERKVMRVNSPRYQRGLMIPSQTEDLEFTALAARFESRAEEGVLSVAVRLGF